MVPDEQFCVIFGIVSLNAPLEGNWLYVSQCVATWKCDSSRVIRQTFNNEVNYHGVEDFRPP